jgi:hypothetical protein
MKKMILFLFLVTGSVVSFGQYELFMEILENKKICNKEDELTYFLQSKSFERQNEDHYYHYYTVDREMYTTCLINQNECYAIYHTDNASDYNKIKAAITKTCQKEYAADKSVSYICNEGRIQDVQIIFSGYLQMDKVYEIMIFQNPNHHELPYNQADRPKPVEKKVVKKTKAKARSVHTKPKAAATKKAVAAPEKKEVAMPEKKVAKPEVKRKVLQVKVNSATVPSVIK